MDSRLFISVQNILHFNFGCYVLQLYFGYYIHGYSLCIICTIIVPLFNHIASILICLYTYTMLIYLKKLADSISQCLIFKIFLGGMPPDLPSISMLCMLIVFHTMCEKGGKVYKGLFPNFDLAWCPPPPNKNHLPIATYAIGAICTSTYHTKQLNSWTASCLLSRGDGVNLNTT